MKHFLAFFAVLLIFRLPAQITLEHTYPGETRRVKLEKSGVKYFRFDQINYRVGFYNTDHTIWHEIALPVDTNGTVERIFDVSETKLIPDDQIEVLYLFNGGVDGLFLRLMNEAGKIYLNLAQVATFEISQIAGHPTKLMTASGAKMTQIIAVPSLIVEHTFPNDQVRRIQLDNGEVKYFYSDTAVHIYNSDYSLYKHVPLPLWFKSGGNQVIHASQNRVIADQKLEIFLRLNQGGALLLNEDGLQLKRSVYGVNMDVSVLPGHPDKLILDDTVFALPGITTEHIYKKFYPFRVSVESGPIYLMGYGDSLRYYNASHQKIANIRVPHRFNFTLTNLYHFSENVFNTNNDIDLLYKTWNFSQDSAATEGRICDHQGNTLLTEPDLNFFIVSQLGGGLPNKLLAFLSNIGEPISYTKVYGLPSIDLTGIAENNALSTVPEIFPNPAADWLKFRHPESKQLKVTVYDLTGAEQISKSIDTSEELDIRALSPGVYLIQMEDESGNRAAQKLLVN